ncbi:F-box/kelch-repeat protein At3g23880-like [Rosa rugosa]|uniref:F-box/kelch-repeat protein At3g23880-like n=1 Tax=Rosa rugosa TaxID=74645 RepID=UPI002B40BF33|nr:F-box/kelch-repeat protein At3g23880-like [Rosa rugosa]
MVKILERLPLKSLIRFTSVSKRWRSIILSDPKFAKSQFQTASDHQTCCHRVLISTPNESEFQSRNLGTPWSSLGDNSSVTKVRCPFNRPGTAVNLLCSCNGLVCALHVPENHLYIWNPSTGFFFKLPEPVGCPLKHRCLVYYGFGYLSASDDYKLIAKLELNAADDYDGDEVGGKEMHIFSSRANIWKTTEAPLDANFEYEGALSNEALHWPDNLDILAFDLAREEFRRLPLPTGDGDFRDLRAFGDCLCAFDFETLDLWVMKEYGVADSWTKLFKLKVSDQPEEIVGWWLVSVMETSTFLQKGTLCHGGGLVFDFIRSVHTEDNPEMHVLSRDTDFREMIEYQETLLWLGYSLIFRFQPPLFFIHWNCFGSHF